MNDKKLIALVTNHDDDVYCFRKELIEKLISEGYKILISCPYGGKFELMQNIDFKHVNTQIDRRGTNIFKDLKLFLHYYFIYRKHKPSIVLNYTIKPNIYSSIAASMQKIPYINNVTGLGSIVNKKGLIKIFIMFLLKTAFKNSSCVFFQNQENLDLALRKRLVKGKYKLIPGSGVNIDRFKLLPYPTNEEKIVFNYIGRVLQEKGIDDYIKAAQTIKSEYPNTQFNIIGFIEPSEKYYYELLQKLQNEKIITYHGNQKDIRPFIARSHCTIHPSKYGEGISNVLLESASSGRPIITTDIAGCREVVQDGVTGFIAPEKNSQALAEKIREFIRLDNNEKRKMGQAGRTKVENEFNRQIVINAYLLEIDILFKKVANNKILETEGNKIGLQKNY